MALSGVADRAERVVYRVAGLPVAVWALLGAFDNDATEPLQSAFVSRYWHPDGASDWSELVFGIVAWPVAILLASAWFTWRNGAVIRRRYGKSVPAQFAEQLKLYFSAGVLPSWYYIISLPADGPRRAATFIPRFESTRCDVPPLTHLKSTPLTYHR